MLCGAALFTAFAPALPARAQPPTDFKRLVEQIAEGNEDESAEAADRLIERVVAPLTEALAGLEARPPQQQKRLLQTLGRLTAVIRVRLYRGTLPAQDRQLFDEFSRLHGGLVEALFQDDPERRRKALQQIPLEPGTGAGVLITAKVEDWDFEVMEAAFKAAATLKDEVVARGLVRYLQQLVETAQSGQIRADQVEYGVAMADTSRSAIRILGQAGAHDAAPVILDAVRTFGRPPLREFFALPDAFEALGRLGDESAVPVLLEFVHDRERYAVRSVTKGTLIQQTVGDAALLALTRIYGIPPEQLGFYVDSATGGPIGFTSDETRTTAVRAFLRWQKENGDKPRPGRAALATQPSQEGKGP